jgi:hypothetical protein
VSCGGSYTSGSESVYVDVGFVVLSDGNSSGLCSVSRRRDRVIDITHYTGGLCFLTDWSSLDPDGGTDVGGNPLALSLLIDVEDGSIRDNVGATVIAPLTCFEFDPETGDFLE